MNFNNRIVSNHYEFYKYLVASSFRKMGEDKITWIDGSPSSWPKLVCDVQDDANMKKEDVDNIVERMERKEIPALWIVNDIQEPVTCEILENHQLRHIRDWPGLAMEKSNYKVTETDGENIKKVESLEDLEEWLNVFNEVFNERVDRKLLLSFLYDSNVLMYTGMHNGIPSGTALGFIKDNTVGIYMLGVLKDIRKSGLARKMVNKIMINAIEKNVNLAVCSAMKDGLNFWKKMGFEQHSTFKIYWKLGKEYK